MTSQPNFLILIIALVSLPRFFITISFRKIESYGVEINADLNFSKEYLLFLDSISQTSASQLSY